MGAAYFYHLTDSTLEQALPQLIERARGAGWRVAVRGPDTEALERLDKTLWQGAEEGFLPHGLAGGAHDALQPVLLCGPNQKPGNDAACWMIVQGAAITSSDVTAAERVCILFDGHDEAAVVAARGQWKSLTDGGCAAQYWAQEDGRWTKKAESD